MEVPNLFTSRSCLHFLFEVLCLPIDYIGLPIACLYLLFELLLGNALKHRCVASIHSSIHTFIHFT